MRAHLRGSHVLYARADHCRQHDHIRSLLWVLHRNMLALTPLTYGLQSPLTEARNPCRCRSLCAIGHIACSKGYRDRSEVGYSLVFHRFVPPLVYRRFLNSFGNWLGLGALIGRLSFVSSRRTYIEFTVIYPGSPIAGALLSKQFIWWRPTLFAALCVFFGALCFAISRFWLSRRRGTWRL